MFIETQNGWINLSRTSHIIIGDFDADRGGTAVKFNTSEEWVSTYVVNIGALVEALRSPAQAKN